jgi:hypothetical protein
MEIICLRILSGDSPESTILAGSSDCFTAKLAIRMTKLLS